MRCVFPNPLIGRFFIWVVFVCHGVADTLVFKDGDRVRGKLIRQEGEVIVFQSIRFGEIRTVGDEAKIEIDASESPSVSAQVASTSASTAAVGVKREQSPARTVVSRWWQPWTGRIAIGTEAIQDASDRESIVLDARLERKWERDQLRGELHYEYREQNQEKENDMLKTSVYWKHSLPKNFFTVYRPVVEWNRYSYFNDVFTPYVLIQQEIGIGLTVLDRPTQKLSLGFSENLFNVWVLNRDLEANQHVESAFLEAEITLPWGAKLVERGVLYYSFDVGSAGFENSLEISRQLTSSLSLGLQHQYQHNLPDLRLQNYRRVRLFLGYDF